MNVMVEEIRQNEAIESTPRQNRWWKRIRLFILSVLLLLSMGYAVLQEESFYKTLLLPQLSAIFNVQIETGAIRVSPYQYLEIENLKIVTEDGDTHQVGLIALHYDLKALFWGVIRVERLLLASGELGLASFQPQSEVSEEVAVDVSNSMWNQLPWYLTNLEVGHALLDDINVRGITGVGPTGISLQGTRMYLEGFGVGGKFPIEIDVRIQAPQEQSAIPQKSHWFLVSEWEMLAPSQKVEGTLNIFGTDIQGGVSTLELQDKFVQLQTQMDLSNGVLELEKIVLEIKESGDKKASIFRGTGNLEYAVSDGKMKYSVEVPDFDSVSYKFVTSKGSPLPWFNVDLSSNGGFSSSRGYHGSTELSVHEMNVPNTWIKGAKLKGSRLAVQLNQERDGKIKLSAELEAQRDGHKIAHVSAHGKYRGERIDVASTIDLAIPDLVEAISKRIQVFSGSISGPLKFVLVGRDLRSLSGDLKLTNVITSSPLQPIDGTLAFTSEGSEKGVYSEQLSLALKQLGFGDLLQIGFDGTLRSVATIPKISGRIYSSIAQLAEVLQLVVLSPEETLTTEGVKDGGKKTRVESPKIPIEADLELAIDSLDMNATSVSDFQGKLLLSQDEFSLRSFGFDLNGAPIKGELRTSPKLAIEDTYVVLDAEGVELGRLLGAFNNSLGNDLSGTIKRLRVTTQESSDGSNDKEGVHVLSIGASLESLVVPAYLQETPPVNLLFLPIDALNQTVGTLGELVLPSAVTEVVQDVNGSFKEAGRIVFDDARIRLRLDAEGVRIEDTVFNGNILPTFTFDGEIGFDDDLDLVIGIEILKVPVPLTVGGTLDLPLPDLVTFPYQVARSIGLGIANVGEMLLGDDEREALVPEEEEGS